MRTTRKVISVEIRSRSEWAASAKRPRLPDNRPTRSLRAAKLPLATIEAVVTACLDWCLDLFPHRYLSRTVGEFQARVLNLLGRSWRRTEEQKNRRTEVQKFRSSGVAGVQELQNG